MKAAERMSEHQASSYTPFVLCCNLLPCSFELRLIIRADSYLLSLWTVIIAKLLIRSAPQKQWMVNKNSIEKICLPAWLGYSCSKTNVCVNLVCSLSPDSVLLFRSLDDLVAFFWPYKSRTPPRSPCPISPSHAKFTHLCNISDTDEM